MPARWLPALALLVVAGCQGAKEVRTAASVDLDARPTGRLEVAAFQGGYGIDFYQQAATELEEKFPGLKVAVWGNPRVWEMLRPRFIAGDPPDLVYPGWGMDHWALAEEGQLMPLDAALDTPAAEGGGTWRESFEPSLLALGRLDGVQWVLPHFVNVLGWWYDPDLFARNGWKPPATFAELLTLCDAIRAKGIAPITFQGKYPYYMIDGMLLPWCYSLGGDAAVRAAQNLELGAWRSEAMLGAATMIDELRKRGFFQRGAVGMSHTESQQELVQGRAAMIPCGTWLRSEMRNVMPPEAKLEFMLPPQADGGSGANDAIMVSIEPWMIPAKGKNPSAAIAFFKHMTSSTKARAFIEEKGTLVAVRDAQGAKLPPELVTAAQRLRQSEHVWSVQYRQWYPAFNSEIENALTAMLNGKLSPREFCERVEAAAEVTRKDVAISKHKL